MYCIFHAEKHPCPGLENHHIRLCPVPCAVQLKRDTTTVLGKLIDQWDKDINVPYMNIYGIELRKRSLHYLHMYFYLYLSLPLYVSPSFPFPLSLCGNWQVRTPQLCLCWGWSLEILNIFNMMPKANAMKKPITHDLQRLKCGRTKPKIGLGLAAWMAIHMHEVNIFNIYIYIPVCEWADLPHLDSWCNVSMVRIDIVIWCLSICARVQRLYVLLLSTIDIHKHSKELVPGGEFPLHLSGGANP